MIALEWNATGDMLAVGCFFDFVFPNSVIVILVHQLQLNIVAIYYNLVVNSTVYLYTEYDFSG